MKTSVALAQLDSRLRPKVENVLAQLESEGIGYRIICALRSEEAHAKNVALGTSWTKRSLHCPQIPEGLSLAIDIAFPELFDQKNWAPKHKNWLALGMAGEAEELIWGGRWAQADMGHLELRVRRCRNCGLAIEPTGPHASTDDCAEALTIANELGAAMLRPMKTA
jgi:hypothetical protein